MALKALAVLILAACTLDTPAEAPPSRAVLVRQHSTYVVDISVVYPGGVQKRIEAVLPISKVCFWVQGPTVWLHANDFSETIAWTSEPFNPVSAGGWTWTLTDTSDVLMPSAPCP